MQGARGVRGLQHTAHGGDGGAHGGACVSSSGSAAVGGGDRDARSAARDSGSEHRHGGGIPQRRGVVCAPFWRDAERTRAFALVHAGVWVAPQALLAPVRYWFMRGVRYFTPAAAAPPTYVSWGDEQAAFAPC